MRFGDYLLAEESKQNITTFYHENAVAIFLKDKGAKIDSGQDVMKYFYDKKVIGLDPGLSQIPAEEIEKKYSAWINAKITSGTIPDAKSLATGIRSVIGIPNGPVFWTGPTNDATRLGAADIMFKDKNGNEVPISLKKGSGQLKNLGLEKIGDTLLKNVLKPGENLVQKVDEPEFIKYWDEMTREWMKFLASITKDSEVKKMLGKYNHLNWEGYLDQKLNAQEMEIAIIEVPTIIEKSKKFHTLRYFGSKIYGNKFGSKGSPVWGKIKEKYFNDIFGKFFEGKTEIINKNLKTFFQAQISVGDNEMWYAAEGGKKILYVPSKEKFESVSNDLLSYNFKSKPTPTGYEIIVYVSRTGGKAFAVMTVQVRIRWKDGQMNGKPTSSSDMKIHIKPAEWNAVFSEKAMFIK